MVKDKKVLVTGGTGFLGKRLQMKQSDWIYMSSEDCNLTNPTMVRDMIGDIKPDAIVHLAARVGGIKDNVESQADFYYLNTMMNTNIIHQAHLHGVERILSSLSTCAFPDTIENFPYSETDFFRGPPTKTNFSYGMTKRMLHVSSTAYRNQYGRNYSTFCPSNIYGPNDHFNKESSHFVPALIHKVAIAKDNSDIILWGTGLPLRQQLYVDDLCDIIPILLNKHNSDKPLIVAPNQNLSILDMAKTVVTQSGKKITISFNGKLDGQFRKDGSNEELFRVIGPYNFTKFEDGARKTYNWYLEKLNE
ncbi:MAG: hypothetical protein CMC82_01095 [Flavobacteriaceae bacterium]|nr:hypothetical protein [Flavobacteriaceae bacterium]